MSDTCENCGTQLRSGPGKGRPRKYCTDLCRQAAHRRRLTAQAAAGTVHSSQAAEQPAPAPRTVPAGRTAGHGSCAGDDLLAEIARDIQDGARDLARLLPSLDGEEPLRRIAQLQEQLEGLTAAMVGRARYRRITWATVSSILRISEDTARHRYTDRYVLRRIARFNRSETAPTSLAALFTAHEQPSDPGGEPDETAGDRGEGAEQQSTPVESSGAAYNRLAPILSMLIRTAQLTNKEVSGRIGCSASYLSRILSGERVPTWDLTRKFAQACGADPEVLRTVWESEKLRYRPAEPASSPDGPPLAGTERLRAAIHTLHLRAGRPSPADVAVASRWVLTASAVASILETNVLPPRTVLHTFVRILGGDIDHFDQLLDDAHNTPLLRPETSPSPTPTEHGGLPASAPAPTDPATGPDAMLKTFSKVLTEDHTVEDGRARLLHKRARKPEVERHRRPLASLTDALRQRALTPATAIVPLGGA